MDWLFQASRPIGESARPGQPVRLLRMEVAVSADVLLNRSECRQRLAIARGEFSQLGRLDARRIRHRLTLRHP